MKVKSAPPWLSGTSANSAARSVASVCCEAGPGTTALSSTDSGRPSGVHTAPTAPQSVVSGSTTVTASSENESTVISHSRLGTRPPASSCSLSSRRAALTAPFVTVKTWATIVWRLIANASLNTTSKVNGLWCCAATLRIAAVNAVGARAGEPTVAMPWCRMALLPRASTILTKPCRSIALCGTQSPRPTAPSAAPTV